MDGQHRHLLPVRYQRGPLPGRRRSRAVRARSVLGDARLSPRAALAARPRGGFPRAGIDGGPARGRAPAGSVPRRASPAAGASAIRPPAEENGMTKAAERVTRAALAVAAALSPALAARWAEALF